MPNIRLIAATVLIAATACAAFASARAQTSTPDLNAEAVRRGLDLVQQACAGCHAVGLVGDSPMPAATPFRVIVHRYPLDQLQEGFGEGLVTSHPAMPEFVFRASEIDDLIAYLETVKARSQGDPGR